MELRREYLPLDHPQTLAAQEALADFLNLGAAKYAEAEPLAKRTWEARARVLGPRHRDTLDSMDTYCTSLDGLRRYGESIAVSRQCYEARREVLGADDPDTLTSMNNLAFTLVLTGKRPEAIALLRQAVDSFHKRPGSEHAVSLQNLAHALYLDGDLDEAEKLVRDGLEWFTPRLGKRHLLVSNLQSVQVRIWVERGDLSRAAAMGSDVVALRRGLFPEGHWAVGTALQDLGCCMVLQGKCAAAEKVLRESREVFNRTPPRSTYWVNWTDCWYAASLAGQGRFPEAASILIDAEQGLRASPMTPNRHHRMAVEQLVRFYEAWKKPDEAARWRAALAPSKKP